VIARKRRRRRRPALAPGDPPISMCPGPFTPSAALPQPDGAHGPRSVIRAPSGPLVAPGLWLAGGQPAQLLVVCEIIA